MSAPEAPFLHGAAGAAVDKQQAAEPPAASSAVRPHMSAPAAPAPQRLSAATSAPAAQEGAEGASTLQASSGPSTPQTPSAPSTPQAPPQAPPPQAAAKQKGSTSKQSKKPPKAAAGGTTSASTREGGSCCTTPPSAELGGGSSSTKPLLSQALFQTTSPTGTDQPPSMDTYLSDFEAAHIPTVVPKKSRSVNRARPDIGRFFDVHVEAMEVDMRGRGLLDSAIYAGCFMDLNPDINGVLAVRPAIDNMSIFFPRGTKVENGVLKGGHVMMTEQQAQRCIEAGMVQVLDWKLFSPDSTLPFDKVNHNTSP
ncbi:hypothetical protein T484DRAFT_1870018 [Baffinella frigidus]|nr:hypothetical protein T484DRAFT_1870018 [Cryptophyta sp. CCMP2293]